MGQPLLQQQKLEEGAWSKETDTSQSLLGPKKLTLGFLDGNLVGFPLPIPTKSQWEIINKRSVLMKQLMSYNRL